MSKINFPANPIENETFVANNISYVFSNGRWRNVSVGTTFSTLTDYVDSAITAVNLADLADVDTTSTDNIPVSGDVLSWDDVNSKWIPSLPGATVTISETAPANVNEGDLWYDPSTLDTYIYYLDGNNNYIWVSVDTTGAYSDTTAIVPVAGVVSYRKVLFTATADQTSFSVLYTVGYVDVYLNGVKLIDGDDYTATSGNSIVLSVGAAEDDIIEIVVWRNNPNSSWLEKSINYTAVSGDKLFVDCSEGAVTVTLPSTPSMGDEIRIIDATGNSSINNITIDRNGNNILSIAEDLIIDTDRAAFGLVFYNSTQGWILTEK